MTSFYETTSGQIVRGEPTKLPVLAIIWTGNEKDGWTQDMAKVLGEVERMSQVGPLLAETGLLVRDRALYQRDEPHLVAQPLRYGEDQWPAHILVHAVAGVPAQDPA